MRHNFDMSKPMAAVVASKLQQNQAYGQSLAAQLPPSPPRKKGGMPRTTDRPCVLRLPNVRTGICAQCASCELPAKKGGNDE